MFSTRFCATAVAAAALVGGAIAGTAPYVSGEVLVKFKPQAAATGRLAHSVIGARIEAEMPQIGWQTVRLPAGMSVENGIKYYRGLSEVASVEPNYVVHGFFTPNDPSYNQQYMHKMINTPAAWDLTLGDSRTVIAIIDTGVDYTHPDLSGKVLKGKDFVNNDADPMDDHGHGTHCSGIAAAKTNNGVGIAGAGFNCSILAEKVLGADGSGQADWTTQAILDATDRGVQVISMSLGGSGASQAEEDAVNYAWNKGVVLVAASGNDGVTDKHYPGAFVNCICVGASDQSDKRANFSNYGADWVDVAAPGVAILSTLPGNKYEAWDGTSMATPVVAGVLGLMKSYGPNTTNVQLRSLLEGSCDNVGNWISKGRVNAFKAVQQIIKPVEKEFNVGAIGVYGDQGTALSGTPNSLKAADADKASISSVYVRGSGSVAAMTATLNVNQDLTKVRTMTFSLRTQAPRSSTVQIYFYNFSSNRFEVVKSVSGTGNAQSVDLPVTKYSTYIKGSAMNVIVRSLVNSRAPSNFTVATDVMKLKASVNPQ